jgi:hypothetical protein
MLLDRLPTTPNCRSDRLVFNADDIFNAPPSIVVGVHSRISNIFVSSELRQQRTISTTTKTGFTTHFPIGDGTNHTRRISHRHESHVLSSCLPRSGIRLYSLCRMVVDLTGLGSDDPYNSTKCHRSIPQMDIYIYEYQLCWI